MSKSRILLKKKISIVFDGWVDFIHDSTIQMDTDTDGYRYNTDTIQMDKLFNFIWNSRFDGWIDCIHDCIHDSTIQMDTDTDTDGNRYRWI